MTDHIARAAKVIADFNACGHCEGTCGACRGEAEALDAAGLLATPERDAEVRAIEVGIEALTRTGYDHTPDCVKEQESARAAGETFWHPDCGRCWQDSLHDLLNPTEGDEQ